jgi:hypothetical protein
MARVPPKASYSRVWNDIHVEIAFACRSNIHVEITSACQNDIRAEFSTESSYLRRILWAVKYMTKSIYIYVCVYVVK